MKSKVSTFCLVFLTLFFTACKKESSTSIVGQWMSVSVYTIQDNGMYQWTPVNGLGRQFYNFSGDGRFGERTDVPGGSGSYNYDEELKELTLSYEANRYVNITDIHNYTVEMITNNKLVLSFSSPLSNFIRKTEYSRVNE